MRLILPCILIVTSIFADNITQHDIKGIWEIPEEIEGQSSIGEIFVQDGQYYAYAFAYVKKDNNQLVERKVDSEQSNAKNLKDKVFLYNLKFDGTKWDDGKIYNPNNGSTYYAQAYLSDDKKTLEIRVSIDSFGLIGKTLVWNRMDTSSFSPPPHNKIVFIDELKETHETSKIE